MKLMSSALQCTTTEIVCDRCAQQASHDELDFEEYTSIDYVAGYGAVFGDGSRVQLDLCQSCVQQVLGAWLRVTKANAKPIPVSTPAFQGTTSM
jgi:hypothetical protein